MEKRKPSSAGSTTVAAALALFLLAFTGITVYLFVTKPWWFPKPITEIGILIDSQFHRTLIITGIVFVLAQLGLAWVVFKYRDRGQKASYFEGNNAFEVLWTLATIVLFVGLGLYAESAWAQVHFQPAQAGDLQIEVTGQQFTWNFRYPGPDGKFGMLKPSMVSASTGNALGLDRSDPEAKDDIVSPILGVPVNREVELLIRSQDVTHSFFVRELRIKQDAVPGMIIHMHFTATETGEYDLACAELCGLGHYKMSSKLKVMSDADFAEWINVQVANQ
jgi:cytochrome c oxidase subunit 2